jgi:hypothetical protein
VGIGVTVTFDADGVLTPVNIIYSAPIPEGYWVYPRLRQPACRVDPRQIDVRGGATPQKFSHRPALTISPRIAYRRMFGRPRLAHWRGGLRVHCRRG